MENLYKILEVDKEASPEVIKKAYRALAEKYHPDKSANNIPISIKKEKMAEINNAYSILSNPAKRKQYNQTLSYNGIFEKRLNYTEIINIILMIIFTIGLSRLLLRSFPQLIIIIIPAIFIYLFIKYPKTFARLFISVKKVNRKN